MGWGRQGECPRWQERQAEQGKDTGCLSSDCCAGIVLGVKIPNLAQAAYTQGLSSPASTHRPAHPARTQP